MISYLPVSHIVAQIADIWMIPSLGGTIHFADRDALRGSLLNTLTTVRPTRFVAVPRVFEKMHQQLETTFSQATGPKAALLNWATKVNTCTWHLWRYRDFVFSQVALEHTDSVLAGGKGAGLRYRLAERLLLEKVTMTSIMAQSFHLPDWQEASVCRCSRTVIPPP